VALTWTATRDALSAALPSAANADRPVILAARARVSELGARYDAAATAGTLLPVAGDVAAGTARALVRAAQFTATRAAFERAVRYLESLPGVEAGTPFRPADTFPAGADDAPSNASAAARRGGAPGSYIFNAPAPAGTYALRADALLPGAAGNALALRIATDDGAPVVEVLYGARVAERIRTGNGGERVGRLARVTAPSALPAELVSGDTRAMLGGTGGARAAVEFRARLALDAAAEVMARQNITDAERERLAFGRARVEACNAALALRASGAHDATGAELEAELAAAMDAAALVLSYLAA